MTRSTQFQIGHLLAMIVSFSVVGAMFNYQPWLGGTLLVLVSGCWAGLACVWISNVSDDSDFEDRRMANQLFHACGAVLFASCGSVATVVLGLTIVDLIGRL